MSRGSQNIICEQPLTPCSHLHVTTSHQCPSLTPGKTPDQGSPTTDQNLATPHILEYGEHSPVPTDMSVPMKARLQLPTVKWRKLLDCNWPVTASRAGYRCTHTLNSVYCKLFTSVNCTLHCTVLSTYYN